LFNHYQFGIFSFRTYLFMKLFYSLILLSISCYTFSQEKLTTQSGTINFEASVPLFEEVNAINNSVKCVLNEENRTIVCLLKISDFHFKLDLMETHFNDIYMESQRYTKASFKGEILNFDSAKITTTGTLFFINGKIKIHGVTQPINVKALIKKVGDRVQITSDFDLNTDSFGIEIPSMILPKISKTVHTHLNCTLE
jgi:TATA-box binding protein (TBP) (component of TFIID and TFIIIB)